MKVSLEVLEDGSIEIADKRANEMRKETKDRFCIMKYNDFSKIIERKTEYIRVVRDASRIKDNDEIGEWEVKAGKHICSHCGCGYGNAQLPYSFNYCPNCGTRMVGEQRCK